MIAAATGCAVGMVFGVFVAAAALATAAGQGEWRPNEAQARQLARGGLVIQMQPDPGRSSGVVNVGLDVRAPARRIWALLVDCVEAPRLVVFIKACRIVGGPGPAGGWDLREMEIQPEPFLPRLSATFRSQFEVERRISFRCVPPSQLKMCEGEWRLAPTPDGAVRVTYSSAVAAPYPLPDLVIRAVLAREIADSMRTLRRIATQAEAQPTNSP